MPASDKRVYLYMSPALRAWLADQARDQRTSMNKLIVNMLEKEKEEHDVTQTYTGNILDECR